MLLVQRSKVARLAWVLGFAAAASSLLASDKSRAAERAAGSDAVVPLQQSPEEGQEQRSKLPPALLGRWSNTYQVNLMYEFFADGSYIYVGILPATTPCVVGGYTIMRKGVASLVQDGLLILTPLEGKSEAVDCSGNVTPRVPKLTVERDRVYIEQVDGLLMLHLQDLSGGPEVRYTRQTQ